MSLAPDGRGSLKYFQDKASYYNIFGGQKQRIAIASAIAIQLKIIILDKPTSVLYPFGKDGVFEICKRMKKELDMNIIIVEYKIDMLACL